jgi:hypothetical protein
VICEAENNSSNDTEDAQTALRRRYKRHLKYGPEMSANALSRGILCWLFGVCNKHSGRVGILFLVFIMTTVTMNHQTKEYEVFHECIM